jgi:hypothetical protein
VYEPLVDGLLKFFRAVERASLAALVVTPEFRAWSVITPFKATLKSRRSYLRLAFKKTQVLASRRRLVNSLCPGIYQAKRALLA